MATMKGITHHPLTPSFPVFPFFPPGLPPKTEASLEIGLCVLEALPQFPFSFARTYKLGNWLHLHAV